MDDINEGVFKYFSSLIENEIGIQYDETNKYLLYNRLQNIVKILNFQDINDLWKNIQLNGLQISAKSLILDMATNNETSFFRDPNVFEFFKNEFLQKVKSNSEKIKVWSAAASTGQEMYSLAMIFEELKEKGINKNYEILGTDISDRVLKQAENGMYSQLEIQRGLPAQMMVKYFEQVLIEDSTLPYYRIKPQLKSNIILKQMNLLQSWPEIGSFDIIFCRNFLIYLSVENKKKIIDRFTKILNPEGFLILGGAESLIQLSERFEVVIYKNTTVYKLKIY
jgi:chemotaxis protein methyltransferase CheR